ncbi:hypothetical protein [Nocardia brasiliensis]|uniref:Uncharacterized protein n=1 Tax=Nocardia brasiliensis (strain ATCC 700358 / HUJEG-1) TaxID=1133849 RepID=K0EWC2_NOCB7|nr:hypothetical protein [Nocardia brasiliensis]AFU04143.1 hypothetical protein O3I_030970 [Nocardia brasiliensis ATCC 700358]OCF91307.1 hypothetical protein AW168_05855 [Nocardia brasiliensis]
MSNRVMVDVTTFISAEEFILSQNSRQPARPRDPFAQQCYAELVQSLIYFDEVLVPHPTKLNPVAVDYGTYPRILRHLFDLRIAVPMAIGPQDRPALDAAEAAAMETLKTTGVETMLRFIDKTRRADREVQERGGGQRMLANIAAWADYQWENVRIDDHHRARIGGADGVELDAFGQWARASSFAMEGQFRNLIADTHQQLWLIATLVRSLRYSARAKVNGVAYTPHPLRRDFSVMFDLFDDGVPENTIEEVISAVRGIPSDIRKVAGPREGRRLQLLEYQLPLLGGRLWSLQDRGRSSADRWLEMVCGRIDEYRSRAVDFRRALSRCDTEEEARRLELDVEGVRDQLLRHLGLDSAERNATEDGLIETVASVAEWGTGVPVTRPLRLAMVPFRRHAGNLEGLHQKFLYREFVREMRAG